MLDVNLFGPSNEIRLIKFLSRNFGPNGVHRHTPFWYGLDQMIPLVYNLF